MNKLMKFFVFAAFAVVLFTTCKKDDPTPVNEQELITTLKLTFTPVAGGTPIVAQWKDADGSGPMAPVTGNITLAANKTYTLKVEALDEVNGEDITEEIEAEDEEHQFFFEKSPAGLNLTIVYADSDDNGKPVGLLNTLTTGAASTGTLKVSLRHELNKNASGVSAGNIANAGGETDIETVPPFNVTIN